MEYKELLEKLDEKFDKIDERFDSMENKMDKAFEDVNIRVDNLETKVDNGFKELNDKLEQIRNLNAIDSSGAMSDEEFLTVHYEDDLADELMEDWDGEE